MEGEGCLKWPDGKNYKGIKNIRFIKENLLMVKKMDLGLWIFKMVGNIRDIGKMDKCMV